MKAFSYRQATESDLRFIVLLSAEVFSQYGNYEKIVPNWFFDAGVITIISMEGSTTLGFAMLEVKKRKWVEVSWGHLLAIAVLPEHQRKGVGGGLLSHILGLARQHGLMEIELWTAKDNLTALSFFQEAGFRIIGSVDHYYPSGHPAVAMSKRLVL
jgi:ribosomal protein S18 acetylase RimI-like enzyme